MSGRSGGHGELGRGGRRSAGVAGKVPGSQGVGRKVGGKLWGLGGTLAVGGREDAGSPMTRVDHTLGTPGHPGQALINLERWSIASYQAVGVVILQVC